jgi:hypothetical protein
MKCRITAFYQKGGNTMSVNVDVVTKVSIKSNPEYLARVSRIISCLADSVGMDNEETRNAALALNGACVNAMNCGPTSDSVSIDLVTSGHTILMDVADSTGSNSFSKRFHGRRYGRTRLLTNCIKIRSSNKVRLAKRAMRNKHAFIGTSKAVFVPNLNNHS